MDKERIAQNIVDGRWKRKITQSQLAKNIHISPSYMNDIEHGRRLPSLKVAIEIAKAINESLDNIFLT